MGPLFWRHPEHGLKKCAERTGNSCDPTETDGCCAVTACSYCLELAIYGDPSVFSEDPATFTGTGWSGSVGNHTFFGYWERSIYTDECEFIVLFDGEEVYRKSCYEGQSCRDSSDETTVTVGYDEGTLYWRRVEPLPLAHIVDPDTGCKTWYCDSCDCSCTTLCATITEPNGRVQKGELDNVAYECEPPIWEGQIGYYDLSLALGRDIYGRCIIVATVDGEEQTAVLAPGCKNLSTIIELYDGTTIEVACKICDCVDNRRCTDCCDGQHPAKDLYLTLIPLGDCCGDLSGTYTMAYQGIIANDLGECSASWRGSIAGCWIEFTCGIGETILIDSCYGPLIWGADTLTFQGCNPFLVSWRPCAYESSELISKLCTPTCTDVGSPCIEIHLHE